MALALPLDILSGGLPALPSLPGLGSLTGAADPSAGASATIDTGTLGLGTLTGLLGGGLPGLGGGLPDLGGLLGGLGGSSGDGSSQNGSVYGTSNGLLGGLFYTAENATYGIPILGDFVSGATGSQVEGGGTQNILLTQLLGTPLFGPVQSLIGGNSYGDELVLYDLATRPVALTEGLPIVNDLTREIVTGSFPATTAFIGAYTGGLVSDDFLQYLVTSDGTLGSGANALESALSNVPGLNLIFTGHDLNAGLDQVTLALDTLPSPVADIIAGALGGDALSNSLPFADSPLVGTLLHTVNTAGLLAPVGDVFYPAITPITTIVQEVTIAGPTSLGALGKLI